jgi:2-alkyl-3-oxoalkanoate reductase
MKVLVAGATGALGKHLVKRLVANDHAVIGTTRSEAKLDMLRELGATPMVMDALDPDAVARVVAESAPHVIVHEATALSDSLEKQERRATSEGAENRVPNHVPKSADLTRSNPI